MADLSFLDPNMNSTDETPMGAVSPDLSFLDPDQGVRPADPSALDQRMKDWASRVLENGFDGIDVHEAWNFEGPPENMDVLKRFSDRLTGRTP